MPKQKEITLKTIREQYLKLAQKYHPDAVKGGEAKAQTEEQEEAFIQMKESFDRLVELDKDSKGKLFVSAEMLREEEKKAQESKQKMSNLKNKIKMQKQREADVKRRQEEEQERIRQEERARQEKVKKEAYEI